LLEDADFSALMATLREHFAIAADAESPSKSTRAP